MESPPTRILIIDDSVFMRSILKRALSSAPNMEVVGTAQNGTAGIKKIASLKPDLITLDIEMPGMDGLEVLKQIMDTAPLPVVMISTKTQKGAQATFDALDLGAVDYVPKPLAEEDSTLEKFQADVVDAVRAAMRSNRTRLRARGPRRIRPASPIGPGRQGTSDAISTDVVVAIGISAGGPATLSQLVPAFPVEFPPIVITLHMPVGFTAPFAKRLDSRTKLKVKEAEDRDELLPGQALIAPGGQHLKVVRRGERLYAALDSGPKVSGFRPSVNVLFESVAKVCGPHAVGVVMTGMGNDGSEGIKALRAVEAKTIAQDEATSIVYGMPKSAYETGCVDRVVALESIAASISKSLREINAATV